MVSGFYFVHKKSIVLPCSILCLLPVTQAVDQISYSKIPKDLVGNQHGTALV